MPHSLLQVTGTWVGKLAYLTADTMMLLEGRRAINMCHIGSKSERLGGQDTLE